MAEQRRLATILALDVSGYSRAAERDDSAAADSVRRLRATITEVAAPFGGRIFNSAGDGFMLEFPSAASGVQAAMELLKESHSGERPLPKIRIGLHLGDVIVEENGDLLGHGVNVAARLQALAEPGSAIVSETVRAQVRSVAELPFTSHGRVQLDKMSERLAVYSLSPGHTSLFGGISRRRTVRATLLALSLAAACGIGYGAWRLFGAGGTGAATSISLYQDEPEGAERALTSMGFTAERGANGRLSIRVDFPYRERLERERRIDGLSFWRAPFSAALPTLLVQVTNTGARPLSLNEIQFDVLRAAPNETPLPFVRENPLDLHRMTVVNAGWGSWESPRLDITAWGLPEEVDRARQVSGAGVISYEPCANPTRLIRPAAVSVTGATEEDGATIFSLDRRIPSSFADELFVCAIGQLSYTHGGRQVRLEVRSRVSNRLPDAFVASPAITTYDLYLDPARQGYVAIVPVMREIPPGATDSIALTVYTDRSSHFTLRHSVRTSTGARVDGDVFDLEILVPRQSDVGFVLNETSRMAIPDSAVTAEDRGGLVERASFDPQGREPVRFHATQTPSMEACEAFLRESAPRILQRAGIAAAEMAVIDPDGAALCQTPVRPSGG